MRLSKPQSKPQFIAKSATLAHGLLLIGLIALLLWQPTTVGAQNADTAIIYEKPTPFNALLLSPGPIFALPITENDNDTAVTSPTADPEPDKVVRAVLTAYTSTPDQTDSTPCISADGTNICATRENIVAANWLAFGTQVKIPSLYGDKIFVVRDRMNKRYGHGRMDVYLTTSKAIAKKFGVKRAEVEIYYAKKDAELARR